VLKKNNTSVSFHHAILLAEQANCAG